MNHFSVIKIVNLIATIVFAVMGGILIFSFAANLNVAESLQEASNFDSWKPAILLGGIVSIIAAFIFGFGAFLTFQVFSGTKNDMVAETIYILGLGEMVKRPETIGSEPPAVERMSSSSSLSSIYGFGHTGDGKWTFAGEKPVPEENNAKES